MATNPFLSDAVAGLRQQSNQNLQNNIMPGLNSGAMMAGGFGGSRQRIAQGLAAAGAETGINNAAANMYSQAYDQDQNRSTQLGIAGMQNDTTRYGIDQSAASQAARLGLDSRVADQNFGLGNRNADISQQSVNNQFTLGQGNLALGNRTADQNYALGQGNLGVAQQNAGTNAQSVANQYQLGQGNLALGNRQADQNYSLGMGNLGLGYGNLANSQQQTANQMTLGQGNLALGNRTADQNYNLGLGGLQNQQQANQNSFYTAQRGLDLNGQQIGLQALQQGNNMALQNALGLSALGQTEQNAAYQQLQQYSNLLQPWSGLGGSTSQTSPETGGGWAGAVGGALTAAQLYQMLAGGK